MKRYQVFVRLKEGVLDVQGKAIGQALTDNGFQDIENVRVGKLIELELGENHSDEELKKVCKDILSNPIVEDYELREVSAEARGNG